MQFDSYEFILVFLPILFIGYYTINKINLMAGKVFIVIASAVFYIYGGWKSASILGISIVINFICSIAITKFNKSKKILLIIDIIANVAVLFYFKYCDYFIQSISEATGRDFVLREIILPLGISFFTFQQIMYVVNVYRNNIVHTNLLDYLVYILYFPKLLMGPMVEPVELINQFNESNRQISWENVSYGIKTFSFGLFKKVILADTFAVAVTWGFSHIDASTAMDWFLIMLSYTFEIYFDFSGYSDMAVGVSKMLNIDLPINFDSPYKALSIRDFWKRWHISLTGFLTRYIYIPLGGSKKGKIRTCLNTMIVFLVSGIWHGSNWTFVLWGTIHGFLSVMDRMFEKRKKNIVEIVRWSCTFFAVNLLWLLFRSDSISQWWGLLLKMFTFQSMEVSDGLITAFILPETSFLLKLLNIEVINSSVRGFSLLIFFVSAYGICLIPENNYKKLEKNNWLTMVLSAVAFVWSFLCFSSESVYIYSNF